MEHINRLSLFFFVGLLLSQPPPPQNLVFYYSESCDILYWNSPEDANVDYYNIYKDGVFHDLSEVTNYEDCNAVHDTNYCYTVRSVDTIWESDDSNEVCGTWIPNQVPTIIYYETNDGSISIEWNPGFGYFNEGFEVFRDNNFIVSLNPDVTSYEDTPLGMDVEYCYCVVGLSMEGPTEPSNTIRAVPRFCPMMGDINFDAEIDVLDILLNVD
ncbi:MAG: hypothetical protein HQ510_10425 [Candidatus Marinimicrobia bacterium]|nr:hypothetical protein [Candidatus Neomarinimicrobiota bacterium]